MKTKALIKIFSGLYQTNYLFNMFKVNGNNIKAATKNPDTRDIIFYLCAAVPAASKQVKPYINNIIEPTGNVYNDALQVARYINTNLKYKQDGYDKQKIQLPGRLMNNGIGDCKSFSLLFCACMNALGYKNGFRFASYKPNKVPTHVYNFVLDNKKNLYTFDTSVKSLKESPNYTYIKDMQVEYLTGVPTMIESGTEYIGKRRLGKQIISTIVQGVKKVNLAPNRNAFLSLVALNVRGLATKIKDTPSDKLYKLWRRLGGDTSKLDNAVNKGAKKKPLFGSRKKGVTGIDEEYINEPVTMAAVAGLLTAAGPILIAFSKLRQSLGKKDKEGEEVITAEEAADTENISEGAKTVQVLDAETAEGAAAQPPAADQDPTQLQVLNTGFKPSPILIGGLVVGAVAIYFLTRKKRK
jgi:hypothetical protein